MNQTTKHIQATIRKIIAIMITSIVLFSLLPTNIILAENSKTSANLNDYSELLVDVIQDSEIVYSGKLGGFANGAYANVNFENMIYGYKLKGQTQYTACYNKKAANSSDAYWSPTKIQIPNNSTMQFEIVTMLACGMGGTNNRLMIYDEE